MDKLAQELLTLLRDMLAGQRRMLQLALARQEAMRLFEVEKLNGLMEEEKGQVEAAGRLDLQRKNIVCRIRPMLGGADPTVSEVASRCSEPLKTQLLCAATELKAVVKQLDQHTRINAKVSETVIRGIAKVMKVMTGMAHHAGLYQRNGRKAAIRGVHLLEITA